ncbi:MAG: hypothetical protein IJO34_02450, partial [Akkermansia sp.]|nr:hypothetical protein [Akkermansia sp.]
RPFPRTPYPASTPLPLAFCGSESAFLGASGGVATVFTIFNGAHCGKIIGFLLDKRAHNM